MMILTMASTGPHQEPAVVFYSPDDFPDFHGFLSRCVGCFAHGRARLRRAVTFPLVANQNQGSTESHPTIFERTGFGYTNCTAAQRGAMADWIQAFRKGWGEVEGFDRYFGAAQ
jgi:hypothetical protein